MTDIAFGFAGTSSVAQSTLLLANFMTRMIMARSIAVPKHRRPSTPGDLIREYLDDPGLRLTQGELAARLGISRGNLNAIVNGKRAIMPAMGLRLERVLGISLQTWLNLQAAVDIYDAVHSPEARQIARLKPLRIPAA